MRLYVEPLRRIAIQLRNTRSPQTFKDIEDVAIKPRSFLGFMAGTTGLEPATSAVTAKKKVVTNRKQGQRTTPLAP